MTNISILDESAKKSNASSLKIFENASFGEIRVAGTSENPLFCLADVCKVLDLGNPSQVKTRLDDGVISNEVIPDSLGRQQEMTFVNEDGLYDVMNIAMERINAIMDNIRDSPVCPESGEINLYYIIIKQLKK